MEASLRGSRLSLQQERLWAFAQGSHCQEYVTQGTVVVEGPLQIERLHAAIYRLVERHEILRTVFRALPGMDVPMQVVGDADFVWCHTNLAHFSEQEQQQRVESMFGALQNEPVDLQNGPVLHISVVTLQALSSLLIIRLPALCADSVTLQSLVAELAQEYTENSDVVLKEEEELLQYADVAAWQDELLTEEGAEEQISFWRHKKFVMPEPLRLPNQQLGEKGALAPDVYAMPGDSVRQQLLVSVAEQLSVSKESILLAAWQLFLARLTNQEDLVTGVAYSGRSYEELQGAPGLYTRILPFPSFVDPVTTFAQLVRQVDLMAQEIGQHQMYFTWDSLPTDIPVTVPLIFEYLADANHIVTADLHFHLTNITACTEPFILKLVVVDADESLSMQLHFDSKHFVHQTVATFAVLFATVLEQALNLLDTPVQETACTLQRTRDTEFCSSFVGRALIFRRSRSLICLSSTLSVRLTRQP